MQTYKKEIRSILMALRGSPWAAHPEVQEVITEYGHCEGASKTPTGPRRVSLQIFHACRAIDSLLAHVARHEGNRTGRPVQGHLTLGRSLRHIQNRTVGRMRFRQTTVSDIRDLIEKRNEYMHQAGKFPNNGQMRRFLTQTFMAINEAKNFPP